LKTNYSDLEVILVDDASTDRSVQSVRENFADDPRLKLLVHTNREGLVDVFNTGLRHARGEYIVFMHSDVIAGGDWLTNLLTTLRGDPSIGVAQPEILAMYSPDTILSVGHRVDRLGFSARPLGFSEKDKGQYHQVMEIFTAWNACMILPTSVLEKVGSFDPTYRINGEENDLCWRIRLAGYRVVCVPSVKVYHRSSYLSASEPVSAHFSGYSPVRGEVAFHGTI
jgi:hypothetical protein